MKVTIKDTVAGVWGWVQVGRGSSSNVTEITTMIGGVWAVRVEVLVKSGVLPLSGPAIQKDSKGRFSYICWGGNVPETGFRVSRRAKVYLETIDRSLLDLVTSNNGSLKAVLPGRAKDGLPCCATVKPITDWHFEPETP